MKKTISPIEDFKFSHDADTQGIRIDRYLGTSLQVCIPEKIEGLPVTSIGEGAFRETGIVEVIIPDGVTTIGDRAFSRCTGLTSIAIPEGVTSIGHRAFYGCASLTSIAIPGSATCIDYTAVDDCTSLTSIVIPFGTLTIGSDAD